MPGNIAPIKLGQNCFSSNPQLSAYSLRTTLGYSIYRRISYTKMAEGLTLIGVSLSVIISLCYSYFISSKIPKGHLRFISLLPIFYLFTILPLYLSSALTTGITFFFITWLANFKLLLFAFDHGPLSWGPPKSLLTFISMAALPCKIKDTKNHPSFSKPKKIPLNLPTEILLAAILVTLLHTNRESNFIHPNMVLICYCFLLCLLLDVIVASATTVLRAMVGLELEQASDEPYISTSLQDFWGRRWNLMVTNTLRHTVYLPVRSALNGLLGKDMASLVAVLATFVVSALMHELIIYYLTRTDSTWQMGSFFLLHGVCVVIEMIVKRGLGDRWLLPPFVSGVLTVGFMGVTAFWLFFPPMIDNGLDVKVIDEVMVIIEYMKNKGQEIYFFLQKRSPNSNAALERSKEEILWHN